ncbi:hypothetical protein K1X76_00705 [bacterium]|nr:hypothetical protein [bacterium]
MKKIFLSLMIVMAIISFAKADDVADTNALLEQENCQFNGNDLNSTISCKSGTLEDVAKKIVLPFDAKTKLLTTPGSGYKFRILVVNPDGALGQQRASKIFKEIRPVLNPLNYSCISLPEVGNNLKLSIFKPVM